MPDQTGPTNGCPTPPELPTVRELRETLQLIDEVLYESTYAVRNATNLLPNNRMDLVEKITRARDALYAVDGALVLHDRPTRLAVVR